MHSKCWDALTQWHSVILNGSTVDTLNLASEAVLNAFHYHVWNISSPVPLPHVELISLSHINPFKSSKVKQSRNRPSVAQRVPEGLGFQISWHSACEGGEVVSLMHWPPLPPRMFLILIFTRGWVDPRAMVRSEGNMSLKIPVTPMGIDPGTMWQVVQRLNHYTTPGPFQVQYSTQYKPSSVPCINPFQSCNFIRVNSPITEIFAGNLQCHSFATGISLERCSCTHTLQRTGNFGDMFLAHELDSPLA